MASHGGGGGVQPAQPWLAAARNTPRCSAAVGFRPACLAPAASASALRKNLTFLTLAVFCRCCGASVTTKPTQDTVHLPTPGQLHVESIQLAFTFALCCCYALCMKREELLIFYSFWLRCFVVMMQYVGFLGRSQLFGCQVKLGAPTWHLARANCIVGVQLPSWRANLARPLLSWRAPSPVLARANCPILPLVMHLLCIPFPF